MAKHIYYTEWEQLTHYYKLLVSDYRELRALTGCARGHTPGYPAKSPLSRLCTPSWALALGKALGTCTLWTVTGNCVPPRLNVVTLQNFTLNSKPH